MTDDLTEKIAEIQEEIRKTPYHKATEHHIGRLRAKLAKFKSEKTSRTSQKKGGNGFAVKKTGDASVVLVGPPSVGKSTLINKLTNVQSRAAAYDFTTTTVIPGMMCYQGANIQIFDVPGLIAGASKGKGRGREVISQVRSADLIAFVIDQRRLDVLKSLKKELYEADIRLDQEFPKVNVNKKQKGGLKIVSTVKQELERETIEKIAKEFRVENAELVIREKITMERLIDALSRSCIYLPYITIINKVDQLNFNELEKLKNKFDDRKKTIFVSSLENLGLEELKEAIWQSLELIRVYLRKRDKPDFDQPYIFKKGRSLKDLLEEISICEKKAFKSAKIFGPGAKYQGQEVSLDFQPQDKEVVRFV